MNVTSEEERVQFLSRARWRSRRGMLEIDFFLVDFAEQALPGLSEEEQEEYMRLLECEDVDIHSWLTGKEEPDDPALQNLITSIRAHASRPRT